MCGRFMLLADLAEVVETFHIGSVDCDYRPVGDYVPDRAVYGVIHDGVRRLVTMRWGLVPSWAKDPAVGRRMFNARAETVALKPAFRDAFRWRRCLIVADGFYEWCRLPGRKAVPWLFRSASGRPLGLAGLYETWRSAAGERIVSCTIITTEANELIASVHDRMPVIVVDNDLSLWLTAPYGDGEALRAVLRPYPAAAMTGTQYQF